MRQVSERERQLAKLQNLVLHIHEDGEGASVSAALLLSAVGGAGQTGAAHIDRAQVVVMQEDRAEQEHNQLRDFLWQVRTCVTGTRVRAYCCKSTNSDT
jgi:hypothetical protein